MSTTNQKAVVQCVLALGLLACLLCLSACFSSPAPNTLYTLYTTEKQPLNKDFVDFQDMILVMPIRMAPQLQNRGLLYQHSAGEAQSAANHLWAGPLDQQIADTLVTNLKILLHTDHIAVFPGPRYGSTRYQVEIEVHEFTGNADTFSLEAIYTISDSNRKVMLDRKTFQQKHQNSPVGYSGYATSASQSLGELSRTVAEALVQAHRKEKVTDRR